MRTRSGSKPAPVAGDHSARSSVEACGRQSRHASVLAPTDPVVPSPRKRDASPTTPPRRAVDIINHHISPKGLTPLGHKNGGVVEAAAPPPPDDALVVSLVRTDSTTERGLSCSPPLEALERDALLPPVEVDAYGVAPEDALLSYDASKKYAGYQILCGIVLPVLSWFHQILW